MTDQEFICKGGPYNGRPYPCQGPPCEGRQVRVQRCTCAGEYVVGVYKLFRNDVTNPCKNIPTWEWHFFPSPSNVKKTV